MANAVLVTAVVRGLYLFVGTTITTTISSYLAAAAVLPPEVSREDTIVVAVLSGLLAGFGVLGFRGGGEGLYDRNRAIKGNANAGDVPVASAKLEVTKVN
jgi:hypothetical protein